MECKEYTFFKNTTVRDDKKAVYAIEFFKTAVFGKIFYNYFNYIKLFKNSKLNVKGLIVNFD